MPTVDVVIPTWNKADLVLGCLASLRDQAEHRAIVVDNASTDGTVERVTAAYPEATVVALSENEGFGRAVNKGIAAGTGEIVVVLNNDVVARPDFIHELARHFDDSSVDSVAGVLLTADGAAIDAAGVVADVGLAGYSHLHGQPIAAAALAPTPLGPCGGAAAYRRAALEQVGAFDEEIFAYSEDLELALRLRAHGRRTVLAPDARCVHLGSATLGVGSPTQLRLSGWARGYVLGRYRVAAFWVLLEFAVGALVAARTTSWTPVTARLAGLRRGRGLPRQPAAAGSATVGLVDGLRRRQAATTPTQAASATPSSAPLRVAIEPGCDVDLDRWAAEYDEGRLPDRTPYGFDLMASPDLALQTLPTRPAARPALERWLRLTGVDAAALCHGRLRGVDVLMTETEKRGFAAALLGLVPGSPKIVSGVIWLNDDTVDVPKPMLRALRWGLRRADALYVHSTAQLAPLQAWGVPADRIHYVPFGVNTEFWTPGGTPVPGLIVAVGDDRDRDHGLLADAVRELRRTHPGAHLKIAGPPARPAADGVEHVGRLRHDRLRDLYRSAAVVAIATRPNVHLSGSTAMLEALACGRPLVMTHTPGVEDYLAHGESALLVPPGDRAALARAIASVLDDPGTASAMATRARELATSEHSAEALADRMAAVARLVAGRR